MKWITIDVGLHQEFIQRVSPTQKIGPGQDEIPDGRSAVGKVGGDTEVIVLIRKLKSGPYAFTIPRSRGGVVQHVVINRYLVGIDALADPGDVQCAVKSCLCIALLVPEGTIIKWLTDRVGLDQAGIVP